MRDVQLWWRLHDAPGPDLVPEVRGLAQLTLRERTPFLGLIAPLLSHEDAGLRAAAIAVLAGARGMAGLRAIGGALDDPEAVVREAAIDSLLLVAKDESARWVHAVFHPRTDVRMAALRSTVPDACSHFGAYLRADPECRALAETVPFPKPGFELLFGLWERNAIAVDDAAARLGAMTQAQLRTWVLFSRRRAPEIIRRIINASLDDDREHPIEGNDALDVWVDIVMQASEAPARAAIQALSDSILTPKLRDARTRLTFAVLRHGARHGFDAIPDRLLALAAACDPRMLLMRACPRAARVRAIRGLPAHQDRIGRVHQGIATRVLQSDLVRAGEGGVDLVAAAAAARMRDTGRLAALVERLGVDAIAAAVADDLPGWSFVCGLPPESDGWSERLLNAAAAASPREAISITAIALGQWAHVDNPALDPTIATMDSIGPLLTAIVVQAQSGRLPHAADVVGRLGNKLAPRAYLGELAPLLEGLTERLEHVPIGPALAMLGAAIACCDPADFALAVTTMSEGPQRKLVHAFDTSLTLRPAHEDALAIALASDDDEPLRQWGLAVLARLAPIEAPIARSNQTRALTDEEQREIANANDEALERALRPALAQPVTGLADAIEARPAGNDPHAPTCVALIGCGDETLRVVALIDQWHADEPDFRAAVSVGVVDAWQRAEQPSPLARAWMHAFEVHGFALLEFIDGFPGGFAAFLEFVDRLPGAAVRRVMWEAVASCTTLRRYRDRAKLIAMVSSTLDDVLVQIIKQLDTDVGVSAAKLLVTLHLGGLNVTGAQKQVLERAPDMDRETIWELSRFVRVDGLPPRDFAARRREANVAGGTLDETRALLDLDELQRRCRSKHAVIVRAAAERLIALGTLGERRLAAVLSETPPVHGFATIAATLGTWRDGAALDSVRRLARDDTTPAQIQYRLSCALHDRGEPTWQVAMLKALRVPTDQPWFRREDWGELERRFAGNERTLLLELTDSPHPHVYRNAMERLLAGEIDDAAALGLRRFLEQGSLRPGDLRRPAAKVLNDRGDPLGLPVLLSAITESVAGADDWLFKPPTPALAQALGELLLASTLYGGPAACDENRLLDLLKRLDVPSHSRHEIGARLLLDARAPSTCKKVVHQRGPRAERMFKIFDIADIFAWGVRRGRELTGRLFRVHMTWRRGDFGHTYLDSNAIHVTPLPVLRRDRHGKDVVEALILHEFGHHMYHRGVDQHRVWERARKEGLGHLLNLVADEHLERNLRAVRPEYGDRLKRLASYAFQHHEREMMVQSLLELTGPASFEALSRATLGVAYDGRCVTVRSGDLLRELERVGQPFARFVRALRQGLGNRHGDPVVEEALELFRERFRHSDMDQLYKVTKRLQELFGIDAKLAEQFGGHETIKGTGREAAIHGEDIEDDEVQREVERILDPRQLDRMRNATDDGGKPSKLAVNVVDDASFQKITSIQRVAPDPDKHRLLAIEIRRHAYRLRRYFEEMGLNFVPQRARMRGRAFDRTRARAVVLRGDPRMLVARNLTITTDLFIGVVIDCSGSMRTGGSMDKAHRFGVLIAEAVRGLSNVEARFFGFTDKVIYDAGDERQCAVAALEAGGGNNDAAALYHAAQVAERSRRRSKLLVMISDGLPTECSAIALRALANHITRRQGILCAQVAVRPLAEVCFPHYVEIKPGDALDVSVRRFGEIISGLARQALGR